MPPKRKIEENLDTTENNSTIRSKKQKTNQNNNQIESNIYNWSTRFPTVFDIYSTLSLPPPKTVLEQEIMRHSQDIRSIPDWHEKIFQSEFVAETTSKMHNRGVKDEIIKFVFDELQQYYATQIEHPIFPALTDGVYQADGIIPEDLALNLMVGIHDIQANKGERNFKGVERLYYKSNPVYEAINPSLCCLHKTESMRTEESINLHQIVDDRVWSPPEYDGRSILYDYKSDSDDDYSDDDISVPEKMTGNLAKYQWLPSEFNIDENGGVTIESYINNLHPVTYSWLYDTIAKIFEKFVPLFNKTLTDALNPRPNSIEPQTDFTDLLNESQSSVTMEIMPEVPAFRVNQEPPRTIVDLKGRKVQVIVEIQDFGSLPNSLFDGMDHERIIATGMYCLEANDAPVHMEFIEAIAAPFDPPRDSEIFKMHVGCTLTQRRGFLKLKAGRCVVYPNLWRQVPFKVRKEPPAASFLKFYLVDLATPILSTKNVPPQQSNWSLDHRSIIEGTYLDLLPIELLRIIFGYCQGFGWDYPSAMVHKRRALDERDKFKKYSEWKWKKRTYGRSKSDLL